MVLSDMTMQPINHFTVLVNGPKGSLWVKVLRRNHERTDFEDRAVKGVAKRYYKSHFELQRCAGRGFTAEIRDVNQIQIDLVSLRQLYPSMDSPPKCQKCPNPSEEAHSCPYQCEIGDNYDETYCNCCSECEQECRDAI